MRSAAIWVARSVRRPVLSSIVEQFPRTLELTAAAMLVALVVGLTAGVLAAVTRHGVLDYTIMTLALFGVATPSFWLGLMLVLIFAVTLRWLPTSGQGISPISSCRRLHSAPAESGSLPA